MNNNSEIIIYQSDDGKTNIEVKLENETVWLNQNQMTKLFGKAKSTINEHILNIFKEGELIENEVVRKIGISDFSTKPTNFYNLDVIISVGYRVNSVRGVAFRKWATERLKEYLIKGFTINDDLLKNNGGGKYFKELLDKIKDIRSSEKVLYRQVLDLYATSVDYDPKALESIRFFQIVQNKLHYAVTKNTAAEIIYNRADKDKDFMGLTAFKGNVPTRLETYVAKNYLNEKELMQLNGLVSAFFDLAELKAIDHIPMYMEDWVNELDEFVNRYGKGLLLNAGKISNEKAVTKANSEYDKYKKRISNELSSVEKEYFKLLNKEIREIENKE